MNWQKLFSAKRLGKEDDKQKLIDGRNTFQRDFDRIVFSSSFRRLQNKTQVVPLPDTDFVHTRLTHSIEASCVGRSLGNLVGRGLLDKHGKNFASVNEYDIESIIAAACLAHDIGNPPFGHLGEDAISEYFKSDDAKPFLKNLNEKEIADLQNFEGNAAGFKLLTHTFPNQADKKGGVQLTYSTLAVFAKYPKEFLPNLKTLNEASGKKYGFYQADKEIFKTIADELELIPRRIENTVAYKRHPLTFLVEAADDVCYSIVDFEDGFRMKLISYEMIEELLIDILNSSNTKFDDLKKIKDKEERVGYLRAKAINSLVRQAAEFFLEKEEEILNGSFDIPLLEIVPSSKPLKTIKDISIKEIYNSKHVVEIEAAGFEVIHGLLDAFLNSVFNPHHKKYKTIKKLLPNQYICTDEEIENNPYQQIINITLFVSGMTDIFAIELFRKIRGISIPRYE